MNQSSLNSCLGTINLLSLFVISSDRHMCGGVIDIQKRGFFIAFEAKKYVLCAFEEMKNLGEARTFACLEG